MITNCPLCKKVSEVPGITDMEGKPLDFAHVTCPECGYNTNIKAELEQIRKYHKDARMFDPLEFPVSMPAQEVINKRIEWAKMEIAGGSLNKATNEYEISLLEDAPRDTDQLNKLTSELKYAMRTARDSVDLNRMNFHRQILSWVKAVIERQRL